jgi:hypothetical protein
LFKIQAKTKRRPVFKLFQDGVVEDAGVFFYSLLKLMALLGQGVARLGDGFFHAKERTPGIMKMPRKRHRPSAGRP